MNSVKQSSIYIVSVLIGFPAQMPKESTSFSVTPLLLIHLMDYVNFVLSHIYSYMKVSRQSLKYVDGLQ